jgi:hypothetical protein
MLAMTRKKVCFIYLQSAREFKPPVSVVESIKGFLTTFKGKTEEVTAGLADINLDGDGPSETAGLKYMRQLVRVPLVCGK